MKSEWNQRFLKMNNLYGTEANQFIKDIAPSLKLEGLGLGIAEGEGRNAFFIANDACHQKRNLTLEVWDYSDVALSRVDELKGELPIQTKEVDLTVVDWQDNHYDFAFCVYGHFPDEMQKKVFQGIRETIKSGGWFFGEVYSKEQISYGTGGPKNKDLLYLPQLILDVFQDDFIQHFYVGEVIRNEGELHHGLCHVIQFAIQMRK